MSKAILVVSLVFLISAVTAVPNVLGSKKCTWGPSYWCDNVKNARECGATAHCMDNVWNKIDPKSISSSSPGALCTVCDFMMGELDTLITKNSTEVEAEHVIDRICLYIPAELKQQCTQDIANFVVEILDMLSKDMDPKVICVLLGACQSDGSVQETSAPSVNVDDCKLCQWGLTEVQDMLAQNKTEAEIDDFLENNLCTKISVLKDACRHAVKKYLPQIIVMVKAGEDFTKICASFGLCDSFQPVSLPLTKIEIDSSTVDDADVCDICMTVVGKIQDTLETDEALAENLVEQYICANLGASQDECDKTVASLGGKIKQFIQQKLEPKAVCSMIRACPSSLGKVEFKGEGCDLCHTVFTTIWIELKNKAFQDSLDTFLETQVCSLLGAAAPECRLLVTSYAPALWTYLEKEIDPVQICITLGLCASTDVVSTKTSSLENSPQCVICEYVVRTIDSFIGTNHSEEAIVAALEKVCSILPSTIKTECTNFVDEYGPVVLKLLEAELDPANVCTAIGLCSGAEKKPLKDEKCELCTIVMEYVDKFLQQNRSVANIEKVLDEVCDILPQSYKGQCDALVQLYAPIIIKILQQEATPAEVCKAIKLCVNDPRMRYGLINIVEN